MNQLMNALVIALVLAFAHARVSQPDPEDADGQFEVNDAEELANQVEQQISGPQLPAQLLQQPASTPPGLAVAPAPAAPTVTEVKVDAHNAKHAAKVAKQAAKVANKVAKHAMKISGHAKKSLAHALGALHDARTESAGLGKHQKESLKKAEAHLREATKKADFGKLKTVKDAKDLQKEKMEGDLKNGKGKLSEREQMRKDIQELRKMLKEKNSEDKDIEKALDDLEADLEKSNGPINDESKAELERLRQLVNSLDAQEDPKAKQALETKPLKIEKDDERSEGESGDVVPVPEKAFDIDTAMPYGDLEPFGREDTAQELTESSIKESDEMVDQLERAEVAEEKRAVFRALTRLRGAAITSFDGVARSQSGNIDEYNKINKWRGTHPLHHLADEESDVSKWAFPDNAD